VCRFLKLNNPTIVFSIFYSVDYSEWRKNGFKLNDEKIEEEEKEEVEEEKGMVKKLIQKFKNLLHKLGKRK